jgi:Co/Zn/Cd efflux system component
MRPFEQAEARRSSPSAPGLELSFRRMLWLVTLLALQLNLGEMALGYTAASRELIADGAEWIYDVAIYGLAAFSLGQAKRVQRFSAVALSVILGIGGVHGAYYVWSLFAESAQRPLGDPAFASVVGVAGSLAEGACL